MAVHVLDRLGITDIAMNRADVYSLILSDRTIEYHAFARIFGGAAQRVLADSDRFDRDQDALGIEAVQNV